MYLARLELTNFKNYGEVSLDLSPGFNCFVGNNGVGKTNILDAIHYLSLTKSFFNSSDWEEFIKRFSEQLDVTLGRIFSEDEEYSMAQFERRCTWCPYRALCRR